MKPKIMTITTGFNVLKKKRVTGPSCGRTRYYVDRFSRRGNVFTSTRADLYVAYVPFSTWTPAWFLRKETNTKGGEGGGGGRGGDWMLMCFSVHVGFQTKIWETEQNSPWRRSRKKQKQKETEEVWGSGRRDYCGNCAQLIRTRAHL